MIPARRPARTPQRYPERMPPTFVSGDLYYNGELLVPVNTTQGVGAYGPTVVFDGATSELQDKNGRKILEVPTAGPLSRLSYGNNGPIYFDGDMTYIRFDDAASPVLTGTFHEDAVKKCISLTHFYFYSNQFSGVLPDISKCVSLTYFRCESNEFFSALPDFSKCVSLTFFYCYDNLLSGSLPDFSKCVSLTHFSCRTNLFSGALPDFSKCLSMIYFSCYGNQFSGAIPDFGQCTSLTHLHMQDNSWNSAEISDLIDNLWSARVALGGNSCDIKVQDNAIPDADAIAKIEGTGAYVGDGLKDNGCTVTYDT